MGDHNDRHFEAGLDREQFTSELCPQKSVQGCKGLIEEQEFRASYERPGQGHTLPLASGQIERQALRQMRDFKDIQEFFNLLSILLGHGPKPSFQQAETHVFKNRKMREKGVILKDVADIAVLRIYIGAAL